MVNIGDGRSTNAWDDAWLSLGRLQQFISFRLFSLQGFTTSSTVFDVLQHLNGVWPQEWVDRNVFFHNATLPSPHYGRKDQVCWRATDNSLIPFSVKDCVHSLSGNLAEVRWWKEVWFKTHIPKHAFCMWLACHRRLPTQDRIFASKHEPPDSRCALCHVCMDSHDHLFFQCTYSIQVWNGVKSETSMHAYPDTWSNIMAFLAAVGPKRSKLQRLTLAASIYLIWQERNWRLFRDSARPPLVLIKAIRDVVLKRMAWRSINKKFKSDGCSD